MWCVARKLRNQLMRALHGNTMHPAKRRTTEKKGVDNAACSSTYPSTKPQTSIPTPWKKQKNENEANVTQCALSTSEHNPAHNQSAEEVIDLDLLAQARIGCDVTKVPGDGWCFFHAVSRHCSNWKTWSITQAAELYLQALEWLCNQKYGPKAEEVQLACVPFDDRELELHKQYLLRAHKSNLRTADLTNSEIVLLSKLIAVLQKPRALDSIHHGSFVELWALAETFDFDCLIWSQDVDQNLWVRDQAIVSDQEAHARLQEHPQVLELLHRQIGVTGHYDIVDRSASLRPPFPDTAWTLEWKRAGADAVLQRAADTLETPLPPLPPPCEPPQSSPQEHRSRRGSTAELDGEIDRPTTHGVCQGSARPARRRRTGVRIAQHLQPSCAEHSSCKHEEFVSCDGAIEQEDNVAPHPATAAAATDAQLITDTRSTMQTGADDVWPQSTAVEESEGTATDVDLDSVLSWDSETSERSNDADLEAVVEPHKSWVTIEDRAIDSAKHLATHFRLHPLLPCVLSDKDLQTLGSNSGLVYPAVHCAFDGCQCASDAQPCHPHWSKEKVWRIEGTAWSYSARACCGNAATCLWAHLKENHHTVFEEAAHRAAGGSAELAIPSQYVNALLQKEDQQVPQVGWSVDRRTLRRLQKELQETSCEALICACCAGIHAGGDAGDIAYLSAAELFGSLSLESFTCNWNLDTYMKQYAASACVRDRFDAHEWSRLLPASLHNGQKIVCCPEDLRCTACDVGNGQLCETCELPICHQCLVQMFDQRVLAVPQALANDNWYGYPTELLYKHKVRWIEAAAASPLWTSVVTYYVEADRGHLVEETLHRAEHRTAVRGNVSSFSLPWEEVLAAFAPEANTRMPWTKLPHEPKVMQQFVKITVKGMLHNEAIEWVAGARIRPWVVVALLQHLIDLQHPMCDNHISPEKAKEEVKQRVTQIYGTEETMPLGEAIPEDVPVAAPLSSAQASPKARPTQSSRSRPAAPKQSPPASARHSGQASKPVAAARPDAKLSKVAVDTASGDLARTPVSSTPTKLSVVASDNAQSIARGASIVVAADDTPCIAVVEVEGSEKTNSQTRTTTVEKYVPPVVSVAAVGTAKTLSASMHSPTSRDAPPQKHATPETAAAAALDGSTVFGKRTCPEIWESANATMFVPPYDTRRQLTARDPWAVVLSFQTIVRCIFAKLLGIRMCFRCPACDCRDASGNGCHVTGGLFGLVRGLCGAIEYQTNSTPHFHCNVYSASIWQQPLHELAEKLNNRTIEFDDVKHFLTWIHPETHPDYNFHNAQQAELEAAWNEHNSHEKQDFLCHWPNFIQTDDAKSPWLDDMAATRAVQEAQTFIETYRRVAQSKVSHQQIHWHPYSIVQKCRLPISAGMRAGGDEGEEEGQGVEEAGTGAGVVVVVKGRLGRGTLAVTWALAAILTWRRVLVVAQGLGCGQSQRSGCYPDVAQGFGGGAGFGAQGLRLGRGTLAVTWALAAILTWRRVLVVAQGLGVLVVAQGLGCGQSYRSGCYPDLAQAQGLRLGRGTLAVMWALAAILTWRRVLVVAQGFWWRRKVWGAAPLAPDAGTGFEVGTWHLGRDVGSGCYPDVAQGFGGGAGFGAKELWDRERVLLQDRLRASEAALAATGRSSLERTEETEAVLQRQLSVLRQSEQSFGLKDVCFTSGTVTELNVKMADLRTSNKTCGHAKCSETTLQVLSKQATSEAEVVAFLRQEYSEQRQALLGEASAEAFG
ncbi:unnamed protein product [Durusdinium trenchii]|uniref:DUF6570 domain-containing protein n=1 Tax=Durusdinium trenchii TaxID=1381693 RepID=A0ABP0K2T9_9DINO